MKCEDKQTLAEYGMEATLNEKRVNTNGASMTAPWKTCWRKLKNKLEKKIQEQQKCLVYDDGNAKPRLSESRYGM